MWPFYANWKSNCQLLTKDISFISFDSYTWRERAREPDFYCLFIYSQTSILFKLHLPLLILFDFVVFINLLFGNEEWGFFLFVSSHEEEEEDIKWSVKNDACRRQSHSIRISGRLLLYLRFSIVFCFFFLNKLNMNKNKDKWIDGMRF